MGISKEEGSKPIVEIIFEIFATCVTIIKNQKISKQVLKYDNIFFIM
jgi:hypothetical protein